MLQTIRDRSQGLIVGVIVFFICLTFALFGIQQYLDAQQSVVVAEVNGEEVALSEFQQAFQQLRQRAQAMFGENFDSDMWSGAEAKRSTLDYVINERLLLQVADRSNLRASDAQVAEYIRTSPQFQRDDQFSSDLYRQMVRAIGFSELGFEQQVRKDLVVNQLRAGIGASAFATTEELRRLEQYRQQRRDVGYAIIGIESHRNAVTLSDDAVESYFKENAERYRRDERVAVQYLELSIEGLMDDIETNDQTLMAFYEANKNNYTAQEQRNVNHILIQVAKGATEAEAETARTKALGLRERAVEGEDFESIAKENSDDIGSRTEGGETGFFGRGVMAPEFEEAAFTLQEGQISEPIRTEFGFHIIRLKAIKPGGIKTYAEVQDDVASSYKKEQAEALFFELAERLSELVYEQPDSLEPAASALNLKLQSSDAITRAELSQRFSERLAQATFEPEVLVEGLNSEPIDIANGRIVVVRVSEHEPSRIPEFGEVADTVTKDMRDERAREAIKSAGDAVIERLENGEDLQAVLQQFGIQWESVAAADRDSAKLNRAVSRAAFRMAPPESGQTTYTGVMMGTGDFAIVGVSNVSIPEVEQLNGSDINQMRRTLAADRTAETWRDFVAVLKADATIETFDDQL